MSPIVGDTQAPGASVTMASSAAPAVAGRRVTLVISALSDGGAERVVCALARYWMVAGHHVSVVTIGAREEDRYQLAPGITRIALGLRRRSRNRLEGMVQASVRIVALRRALRQLEPEVVVSFLGRTNVLTLVATRGMRVDVCVCERTDPRRERIGAPWAVLRRLLYPRATCVVVQTQGVAGWARASSRRVHVIPNFVEPSDLLAQPGKVDGPKQLVGMGRLAPEKGFDLLLEAFSLVAPRRPDWSLTIVGEGPERPRLEKRITDLRLDRRVELTGRTSSPHTYLAAAHAFALPSRYEGFPNALLEAMACGLPVVAFDCDSGPREIIRHERNGLLVPAGNVRELAAALTRIMDDPQERALFGLNAREISSTLGPERILGLWSAVLAGTNTKV